MKKYIDKGLCILEDIIITPTFPQVEVENTVREIQGELKKNQEDPSWVAEREFLKALYGNHPYGRMVQGNEESILRIDRADLINLHSNYSCPTDNHLDSWRYNPRRGKEFSRKELLELERKGDHSK